MVLRAFLWLLAGYFAVVGLVQAAAWFVTRLNTNGRMLTSALCRELADASLDSVQVTLYSADEAIHNTLVGAPGYADTIAMRWRRG